MITVSFDRPGLKDKFYIVKVSYEDPITHEQQKAINTLLQTKLSLEQVCSILAEYCKDTYKLTIQPVEVRKGRLPGGYYETFSIDKVASDVSRVRFIKTHSIEVPKVVFVRKDITEEL